MPDTTVSILVLATDLEAKAVVYSTARADSETARLAAVAAKDTADAAHVAQQEAITALIAAARALDPDLLP
jgi:hypothetical protein